MKYWENGFYLEQNENNTRKEISEEVYENLLTEQSNGKEIITNDDGLPVAIVRIPSAEESKNYRIQKLNSLLSESDYVVIKLQELYIMNNDKYDVELACYLPILNNRANWRAELHALKNE